MLFLGDCARVSPLPSERASDISVRNYGSISSWMKDDEVDGTIFDVRFSLAENLSTTTVLEQFQFVEGPNTMNAAEVQ